MGIRADVSESVVVRVRKSDPCSYVAGWPNDDFARWVAFHRDEVMSVLCRQPEYQAAAFCEPDDIDFFGI